MKPGKTTIKSADAGFPPIVEVGDDDRAIWVSFGSVKFYLSNLSNPSVVIVRSQGGNDVRIESFGVSDVQNQFEFHVKPTPPPG